jgi:hypothetical protein
MVTSTDIHITVATPVFSMVNRHRSGRLVGSGHCQNSHLNSITLSGRKSDGIDITGYRPARSVVTYWHGCNQLVFDPKSRELRKNVGMSRTPVHRRIYVGKCRLFASFLGVLMHGNFLFVAHFMTVLLQLQYRLYCNFLRVKTA